LAEIAHAPGVLRLVVGHIDFMADTGIRCSDDERELDALRFAVAMQTRANRLAPAIDGVTLAIGDTLRLQTDVQRALNFGFGGKLCIHPRQVPVVHAAMAPSEAELDRARRVVAADEASGGAAVQLDGRMVDLPVVLQARRTLARACRAGGG
jgi:citrate lyase subunit beta/citryl-CoA lyase